MKLTIFYDSQCPLCLSEMRQLKAHDANDAISLVDLHQPDFTEHHPGIDPVKAGSVLHAQTDSGELLLGLDVTHRAWALVGKHKWLAILRWPVLRWFADGVYLLFARYRYRISWLLTGQARCQQQTCNLK